MIHLGDITKIHGDQIEPVDCITFGSPCQDLSIAGRRAGLAGERSGLFMEAVRIIREMRVETNGMCPTFAIWENVPGAFSSNGGDDFRAVLEELARTEQPNASIPRPPRGGRWSKAGAICGDGWSIAWRLFDAQYWGVPQRRKRIALVADFGGQRAAEILFERESLQRDSGTSIQTRETTAGTSQNCTAGYDRVVGAGCFGTGGRDVAEDGTSQTGTGEAGGSAETERAAGRSCVEETPRTPAVNHKDRRMEAEVPGSFEKKAYTLKIRSGCAGGGKGALVQTEKTGTLSTLQDQTVFQPVFCISGNTVDRATNQNGTGVKENSTFTVNTVDRHAVAYKVFDARGNGNGNIVPTITDDHESRITDYTAVAIDLYNGAVTGEKATSLTCKNDGTHSGPQVIERRAFNEQSYNSFQQGEQSGTLKKCGGGTGYGGETLVTEKIIRWIVRRLTPTECERLQGFPSGWTDIGEWTDTKGKKHKAADTPRYKALGNSIALPQWLWIVQRMKLYLKPDAKLGSLFDGIGGFPLVWEATYGKGTARWASEIEEFPIAVTKKRFGEEGVQT